MLKETFFFLHSILYGAFLLIIYDLIRALRYTWNHNKILIAVGDLLFWLAASIFLFTRVYKWNNGILRWYFFVGLLLGMLVYHVAISPYILKIVRFLLKRLKMCFSWVNILGKGAVTRISKILGIKNGENVKTKKAQNTHKSDAAE